MSKNSKLSFVLVAIAFMALVLSSLACSDSNGGGSVVVCTPVAGMDNGGCQAPQPAPVQVKATAAPVKVQPTAVNVVKILATVVSVDIKGYVDCGTNAECIKDPVAFCKAHVSASQCD